MTDIHTHGEKTIKRIVTVGNTRCSAGRIDRQHDMNLGEIR